VRCGTEGGVWDIKGLGGRVKGGVRGLGLLRMESDNVST
jgi:hypothetical protein